MLNPHSRLYRTRISCMVLSMACPMCSLPVTFGGGITIEKLCFPSSIFPAKYLFCSHTEYQCSSTCFGSYTLDRFLLSSIVSAPFQSCFRFCNKIKNAFAPQKDESAASVVPPLFLSVQRQKSTLRCNGLPDHVYCAYPAVRHRISEATFQCCCGKTPSRDFPLCAQHHTVLLLIPDDSDIRLFLYDST